MLTKIILLFFVSCIFIIIVVSKMFKARRMIRWSKNPDPSIKYFVPVKGFNAFLGLRKDAILSEGTWYRGYSGIIPFEKVLQMEFEIGKENSKAPRMAVTFIGEDGSTHFVKYTAITPYLYLVADDYRRTFILLCETAIAYWRLSKK